MKLDERYIVKKSVFKNTKRHVIEYYNLPIAYDIETTSFNEIEKTSIIYSHCISINGQEHLFRHSHEFKSFINNLSSSNNLSLDKRIVIYVHNLAYEFQFIKTFFDWEDTELFAISKMRNITTAVTKSGIEFRCSKMLSAMSLERLAESIGMKKMIGDLDYSKVRTPLTPLTDKELGYIYEDVRIIIRYITGEIIKYKAITKIPVTSTGVVRRDMRTHCNKSKSFKTALSHITIKQDEYKFARTVFQGGYTKSNPYYTNQVLTNVRMADEVSQYPSKECSELYPMSSGQKVTPKTFEQLLMYFDNNACMTTLTLSNVEALTDFTTISAHKCIINGKRILDNGRILFAEEITISLTNVDYELYKLFYSFDITNWGDVYTYELDYLPKEKILKTRDYFNAKTAFKGIAEKEQEYKESKPKLNGLYGMSVGALVYPETTWDVDTCTLIEHEPTLEDIEDQLYKYNTDKKKFNSYLWGIFTTAYSRRDSQTLIYDLMQAGVKVYYTDTDSVYFDNVPIAMEIIKIHNDIKQERQQKLCKHYNLPLDYFTIKDPTGTPQVLGEWQTIDGEDEYDKFKTLGAKRYLTLKKGKYGLTCAGVNKNAVSYIIDKGGFDFFKDNMFIPEEHSGKKTLTYLDTPRLGIITDYLGTPYEYNEPTGIYMENASFTLKLSDEYKDLLEAIEEKIDYRTIY